jgi:hypothetical protein
MEDLTATTLIFSFIITWTIGLTPPLLIRYAFLRRPMAKKPAIGTSAFFWLLNIILFIAMGSESKGHAALLLIAYVSYWILRREKKKSNPPIQSPLAKPLAVAPNIQTAVKDDLMKGSHIGGASIEERLSELRQLYDKGLITSAVYEERQTEILRQK